MTLPPPRRNQSYVTVSPFAAGHITLPEYIFYAPSDPTTKVQVPSLSFFIRHPNASLFGHAQGKEFRMLFDLGVRAEPSRYVPALQKHIVSRGPIKHRPSALNTLMNAGLEAGDIDAIAISHVHWDHHGDPEDFPDSTFLLGPGAKNVLSEGLPGTGNHSVFDPNLYKSNKVLEFGMLSQAENTCNSHGECCPPATGPNGGTGYVDHINGRFINGATHPNGNGHNSEDLVQSLTWKPLGPFLHTLDLLNDGSIYVVSAPGHLPGHINLLCRTSSTKWVYLGGDTFHDRGMLTGEKWITTYPDESGNGRTCCIHIDKDAAQGSLDRVAELVKAAEQEDYDVETVAAHDVVWWRENQPRLFPSTM